MKRVLTAVVLVPLVLLVVFRAPWPFFDFVVAAIIILALREYLDLTERYEIKPFRWITYLASILLVLSFVSLNFRWMGWGLPFATFFLLALAYLLALVFGLPAVFRRDMKMVVPASAMSAFGLLYIALSLALLIRLRHTPQNEYLLIFILFSVWAGDIAAFYVGRSVGRHKLAPVVSPNKSWEGAIASVVASVGIALLVFHFRVAINDWFVHEPEPENLNPFPITLWQIIVLGVLTNVAAQFGDLFESALKRGAGVKDSGTLLPGHGGILDRIDALLFAIPVAWYYANLTGFLQ
ncbi:MAG TPA: phosphatidate cytidylyltransferase [Terriglobales bacterium]|nr:phosphatidate cytidylyltransferase [Terriglobales bacterium]